MEKKDIKKVIIIGIGAVAVLGVCFAMTRSKNIQLTDINSAMGTEEAVNTTTTSLTEEESMLWQDVPNATVFPENSEQDMPMHFAVGGDVEEETLLQPDETETSGETITITPVAAEPKPLDVRTSSPGRTGSGLNNGSPENVSSNDAEPEVVLPDSYSGFQALTNQEKAKIMDSFDTVREFNDWLLSRIDAEKQEADPVTGNTVIIETRPKN